jgi:vitamin B12 transporter
MERLSFSLIALLAAQPLSAQEIVLDEIVVTPNRTATAQGKTGVSVSVVSESDLNKRRDQSLATTLAALPGVSFTQQGPFGSQSNLRIRGADGRYLSVFVDGIRVSDPAAPTVSYDFGSLMTGDIGRIEVLRGSQSALWGGSAVGGVINITTRAAIEQGTQQTVAAEAGSFGTAKLSYGLTQKDDKLDLSFNISHLHTDGYSAFDGGAERDGAKASRLTFSARYQVSDVLALGGSILAQETTVGYDGYGPLCPPGLPVWITSCLNDINGNSQTRRELGARVFAEVATGATDHLFDLSVFDAKRTNIQASGNDSFSGRRLSLGYQGTTTVSDALKLVYGIDWNKEDANYTNLPAGQASNETLGAFGQVLWSPNADLDISATLRSDQNSGFGDFPTGRLAAAWRPAEGTTIRAAIATGFRAPSIDERFGDYPGSSPFVGNPLLKPEDSLSYELGVEHEYASGAGVSATLFQLEVDNLITYKFGALSTLENLSGVSVRKGLELAANLPISDKVTAGLAYTYTDARRPNGTRLSQVARHDLTLSLDADLSDRLSAGVQVHHMAGRVDNDPNTYDLEPMPDFTVLNAAIKYDLSDTAEAYLKVENLTDERYQLINGYAASRRAIYVGVAAKF